MCKYVGVHKLQDFRRLDTPVAPRAHVSSQDPTWQATIRVKNERSAQQGATGTPVLPKMDLMQIDDFLSKLRYS